MKPKSPKSPEAEDVELFREAIGPVRRIRVDEPIRPSPPKPRARMHEADEADARLEMGRVSIQDLAAQSGESLSYRREELSPKLFRRLKNAEFSIEDELDLHGMPLAQAQKSLKTFFKECAEIGHRCVLIIHGKGLRSEAGPVIKYMVDQSLRQRSSVLAFCSAPANLGGTGAVLVLLKNR